MRNFTLRTCTSCSLSNKRVKIFQPRKYVYILNETKISNIKNLLTTIQNEKILIFTSPKDFPKLECQSPLSSGTETSGCKATVAGESEGLPTYKLLMLSDVETFEHGYPSFLGSSLLTRISDVARDESMCSVSVLLPVSTDWTICTESTAGNVIGLSIVFGRAEATPPVAPFRGRGFILGRNLRPARAAKN